MPYLALASAFILYTLGLWLGRGYWPIDAMPVSTAYLGSFEISKAVFGACCLLLIVVSRRWPAKRNLVHLILGLSFSLMAFGVLYCGALFVVSLLMHRYAHKVGAYTAILSTAAALVLIFKFVIAGIGERAAGFHGMNPLVGWMAARLIVYAFESKAIPRRQRSLIGLLIYGPFSLLLLPGEPPMLSYITYHSSRPQVELDQLGSRQLYRSGIKLVLFALAYRASHLLVDNMHTFIQKPVLIQVVFIVMVGYMLYLQISSVADLSTGLSNLCGYYAPNAFERPFLARSPFDYWRTSNIHMMRFITSSCVFPVARKYRSWVPAVFAAMMGTVLIHVFFECASSAFTIDALTSFRLNAIYFVWSTGLMLLFIPFEVRKIDLGIVGLVLTQVMAIYFGFATTIAPLYGVDDAHASCLFVSMVDRSRRCF